MAGIENAPHIRVGDAEDGAQDGLSSLAEELRHLLDRLPRFLCAIDAN